MNKKIIRAVTTVLFSVTVVASAADGVVYRPGLIQAKFNTADDISSSISDSSTAQRVPGPVMANVQASGSDYAQAGHYYVNPYNNSTSMWNNANTTFGYIGEMYFAGGVEYVFGKYLDDSAYIKINGSQILAHTMWNEFATGVFTAPESGWYPIEVRLSDGNGGKGPYGGVWGADLGLACNTNNVSAASPKTAWQVLEDPGNMSFFRTAAGLESVFTVDSKSINGTECTVCLSFSSSDVTAVRIYSGLADAGDRAEGWNSINSFDIPPDCNSTNLVFTSDCGAGVVFRVFAEGEDDEGTFGEWSDVHIFDVAPSIEASVSAYRTTADFECKVTDFGRGYDSVNVKLITSTDADFTENVVTTSVGSVAGTLGTVLPYLATGLNCGTRYYARMIAENGGGYVAFSDDVEFTTLTLPFTYIDEVTFLNADGTASVSAEITGIYDVASVGVELFVNESSVKTWTLSEAGVIAYTNATLTADDAINFHITVTAGGEDYEANIVYSRVLYVSSGSGNDENSGATPENAFATLSAALNSITADIKEIRLFPGEYAAANTYTVSAPIMISGYGADSPSDVVVTNTSGANRVMVIDNADAVISGVTITGGLNTDGGGGVYILSGMVTNCIISGNTSTDTSSRNGGGGVRMANSVNAVLIDCLVTNNTALWSAGGIRADGNNAVIRRCMIINNKATCNESAGGAVRGGTYSDCVFRGNYSQSLSGVSGGGVFYRCVFSGNSAEYGGGVFGAGGQNLGVGNSVVYDSLIVSNSAKYGGAVYGSQNTLYNCTVISNRTSAANSGAVCNGASVYNCIVWGNTNTADCAILDVTEVNAAYTCASSAPGGINNISQDPMLKNDFTLGSSPCIDSGNADDATYFPNEELRTVDLAGNPRIAGGGVDLGCYEKQIYEEGDLAAWMNSSAIIGVIGEQLSLSAVIKARAGTAVRVIWSFGDGTTLSDTITTAVDGQPVTVTHLYPVIGNYDVSFTVQTGTEEDGNLVSSTALIRDKVIVKLSEPRDLYVSNSGSDLNSGYSWAEAKATSYNALAASVSGTRILLAAGTYGINKELSITNSVTIEGAGATPSEVVLTGAAVCRVFNLNHAEARVKNLTIAGVTNSINGGAAYITHGTLDTIVIRDCKIGNYLIRPGANNSGILVTNCLISNCTASSMFYGNNGWLNPVMADSTVENCVGSTYGGVCRGISVYRCRIIGNNGSQCPFIYSRLYDCLLVRNKGSEASAVRESISYNCTFVGNSGGNVIRNHNHYNAIVWGNTNGNNTAGFSSSPVFYNSCIQHADGINDASADNLVGVDPMIDENFELRQGSPCINAGKSHNADGTINTTFYPNASARTRDILLDKRLRREEIDMGCYEYAYPAMVIIIR